MFELEEAGFFSSGDFVTVVQGLQGYMDNTEYKGTFLIDTILFSNFTVTFQSDGSNTYGLNKGFLLSWSCTQWGEWAGLDSGNCGYVRRPLHNGTMTDGLLKYKSSDMCSK